MTRLRALLPLIYVLLIFFISTRPYLHPPGPDFKFKDKLAHTSEYLILGVLLYTGVGGVIRRPRFTLFWILFAIGATLAAMDEVVQTFIPGRFPSYYDWLADVAGLALGVLTAMFITSRGHRQRQGGEAE